MKEQEFNPDCPCTSKCPRHGKCTECVENHKRKGSPTACGRTE